MIISNRKQESIYLSFQIHQSCIPSGFRKISRNFEDYSAPRIAARSLKYEHKTVLTVIYLPESVESLEDEYCEKSVKNKPTKSISRDR